MIKHFSHCAIALALAACSSVKPDRTLSWNEDQLFKAARAEMETHNYKTASDFYTKYLARYPYGQVAQQAALDLAYSLHRAGESDQAIAQYEAFIRAYPRHQYIAYAYYMIGVVGHEKEQSFYDKLNPSSLAQTNTQQIEKSFAAFQTLVKLYPDSEYANDARYRMLYLRNLLAQHQLEIADYYLRRGAYVAAINRASNVVEHYDGSPSVPYALAVLARAYQESKQAQLAQDARRILEGNFPNLMNNREIKHYLNGKLGGDKGLWESLNSSLKI